jgi:putative endonuclease
MQILPSILQALDGVANRLGRKIQVAPHLAYGERGEEEAFFYLRRLGFVVVARDYRSPRRPGDIDLIAWEKETLCFIEVKTRSRRDFMPAEAAVDDHKRATISILAQDYLRHYANGKREIPAYRFDVISVYLQSNEPADITLFRNAFHLS